MCAFCSVFYFGQALMVSILLLPGYHRMYATMYFALVCSSQSSFCFGLILNVPVNSYGHARSVSEPNRTFFP